MSIQVYPTLSTFDTKDYAYMYIYVDQWLDHKTVPNGPLDYLMPYTML